MFWTMPYDSICKEILIEGMYEKEVVRGMSNLISNKKSIFLDVGANIGNHSVFFSSQFEQVIAVEPSTRNNWISQANFELNSAHNVTLIQKGFSDEIGFVELGNDSNKLDTNNGFGLNEKLQPIKISHRYVEIVIGDVELNKLDLRLPITGIKIDVEGLEPKVIKGLERTIKEQKPIVFWEAFENQTVRASQEILQSYGMKYFYHLSKNKFNKKWQNKLNNLMSSNCYLKSLNECSSYDGMNVGSFEPLDIA